jgi:hypothetical protein
MSIKDSNEWILSWSMWVSLRGHTLLHPTIPPFIPRSLHRCGLHP